MQKILHCVANPENGNTYFGNVDDYLDKGWSIVSVTAQHVAVATATFAQHKYGGAFIVIEKI